MNIPYKEMTSKGQCFISYSVILTTDMLSAWDDKSSADAIVFTIILQPKQGKTRFSYQEQGKIWFTPRAR